MKRVTILIITIAAILQCNKIWAVYVDTTYLYIQPAANDSVSIFLVANVVVSSSPCNVASIETINSDSINVHICYSGGMLQTTCPRIDTFFLGNTIQVGTKVIVTYKQIYNDTCNLSNFFQAVFELNTMNLLNGISFPFSNFLITLYPNPATHRLQIQIEGLSVSGVNIYNSTGQLLLQHKNAWQSIDISPLPPGLYTAEVIFPQGNMRRRWVKE